MDTSRVKGKPSNLLEVIFHMVFLVLIIGIIRYRVQISNCDFSKNFEKPTLSKSLLFFTIYHLGRRRQNYRSHRVRHCWWWLTRRGTPYRCNQEHSVLHGHHVVNQMNASNVICFASKTSIKRTLSIKQGSLPFFNPQPSTVTQISPLISDTQIDG